MTFSFLNNSLEQWSLALGTAVGVTALLYAGRAIVLRKVHALAARTATHFDDLVATVLASTHLLFIFPVALYLGSLWLELTGPQHLIVSRIAVAALLLQLAVWADTGLSAWRSRFSHTLAGSDGQRRASTTVLVFVGRLAVWTIVGLMMLDNFGFNITTLVTSLGIGGIAVALAVQNILGDLFASLSIMLDKPFEIGDFIIVGDVLGSVEHIGLKTTRLRALGGEQVVFSNGELLKSRIHNHKRMQTRRVAFVLRVAYGTSEQQLRALPQIVRAIVTGQPEADFERAHFFNYGEWSLDFEVVYHFGSPDYLRHMDVQQAIFLALYSQFQREGIEFAHPMSIVRLAEPGATQRPRPVVASAGSGAMHH
jgi:small-conductance mechanosensitive channel